MAGTYAKYIGNEYPWALAGGTVTSVGFTASPIFTVSGSPITSSGTINLGLAAEAVNAILAGPVSGGPGIPSFRALVSADIPALPYAANSFTIIQADSGTSPTATSANDALTFHNADGNLDISGDSGTKTITVNLSSSFIAGNVTAVTATAPVFSSGGTTPDISMPISDPSTDGYLSGSDFTIFKNKQDPGPYITALTGDVTASGPGSVPATLATVNASVGSFTNGSFTVNAKGLITAASSGTAPVTSVTVSLPLSSTGGATPNISIPKATVAVNGYLDHLDFIAFNAKQPAGNYITALTGDATAAGPGSSALTLATVNSSVGTFTHSTITVNAKGLITSASSGTAGTVTSVALTVPSIMNVSGSPVTSSGTLAVTLANEVANTVFAGPTAGEVNVPTFRALVNADLPLATVVVKTGAYTISPTDNNTRFLVNTTGGAFSITLPASGAGVASGFGFYLVDQNGNLANRNLTLVPNGSDKLAGVNGSKDFQTAWGGWYIFTDGVGNWFVV